MRLVLLRLNSAADLRPALLPFAACLSLKCSLQLEHSVSVTYNSIVYKLRAVK